ncbi:MAG TPA: ABC transporter permease [Acetobacteraceae bacterium]|nr:ABC transporter permease [Acetobacteraceae bacterium]
MNRRTEGVLAAGGNFDSAVSRLGRHITLLENRVLGVTVFLALLILFFSILDPRFANIANADTIALNASILVIVACGEAIVVLTRNFDLSVGSVVALASYVGLDIVRLHPAIGPPLVLVPILIGGLCGAVNGMLVAYAGVPSVIATLGTMSIFRGLAYLYAGGAQINVKDLPGWVVGIATSHVLGLSGLVVTAFGVVLGIGLGLRYLRTGRQIYAIGSNPEAAEFYGLRKPAIVFRAYLLCGLLTGLAAFLFGVRAGYIVPYLAQGLELTALAAVVVGGVSVLGGSGNVVGAAVGAIALATINDGLILLGASDFTRQFIEGAAIVVAVIVDAVLQTRLRRLLAMLRRGRRHQ